MKDISITTIIVACNLAKHGENRKYSELVDVMSAFRECLRRDFKGVPACDIVLLELSRTIRDDFGYLIGEFPCD